MPKKIASKKRRRWTSPIEIGNINFLDHFNDEKVERVRDKVLKHFNESKQWRYSWRSKWLEYYQLYRNYSWYYEDRPEWQSAYFIPVTFETIETILPRIMSALYDVSPLMIARAKSPDMRKASRMVEMLLDTRAMQTKMYLTHYQAFKEMLIYGTAWLKMGYEVALDYEGPRWYNCDIMDIYPEPYHSEVRDMRYIIHREVNHIDELKHLEGLGIYQGIKKLDKAGGDTYFSHLDRLRVIGIPDQQDSRAEGFHEILEYWGQYRDEDTQELFDVVVTIADRKHVIRFEEAPYYVEDDESDYYYGIKPFIKFVDVPSPGETYGIGEVEVIRYLQLELNDLRNMAADARHYAISPVYQVIKAAIAKKNLDNIVFAPGAMIPTNYVGADPIKPITKDMSYTAALPELDYSKQEIRDATGVHRPLSGAEGTTRKTATEIVSLINEANQRIKAKIQINEICALSEQARMTYLCDRQFTDEEILVKLFDDDEMKAYMKITPTQMKWEGDFRLEPSGLYGHRQLRAQQLMQLLEVAMSYPNIDQEMRMGVLLKLIANSLEVNDSDLFISDKEKEQMRQKEAAKPNLEVLPGGQSQGVPPEMAGMQPTIQPSPEEMAMVQNNIPTDRLSQQLELAKMGGRM